MVAESHLRALIDLKHKIKIWGVLASSTKSTESFAKKAEDLTGYPVIPYASTKDICNDETIDWVIVLTPPNARQDIVNALANAGKPVLSEKPLERTFEAAREIVQICEESEVSLGVVFQHRMRASSQKLKELIDDGALGEQAIAEVCVPWWREQSYYDEPGRGTYERDGGGVLISQAIHSLDLLLSLTGPVSEVQAMAHSTSLHRLEAEDYVTAGMKFSNGAAGTLVASTASFPGNAESITLHFTNCVAHLESGELTLNWRDGRSESFGESASTGGGADPMAFTHDWHRGIIEDFSDSIHENRDPLITGRDALKVHALIKALIQSSHTKQSVKLEEIET